MGLEQEGQIQMVVVGVGMSARWERHIGRGRSVVDLVEVD